MIRCQDSAFRDFFKELRARGEYPKPTYSFNKGRHRLIETENEKYYVVFKREFYHSFAHEFKGLYDTYPHLEGEGESINEDALKIALRKQVDQIVFIHPNGFYGVYPRLIKAFCEKNGLVRTQNKPNHYKGLGGFTETIKETTYSFPKKLMGLF